MTAPMKIVVLGLSLSSSWGNGHAVTYRALIKALSKRGHDVLFLEHDAPWYASHRDLPEPDFCRLAIYGSLDDLDRWSGDVAAADAVVVGSYVPDGVAAGDWAMKTAKGPLAFYDIDTPVTLAKLDRGEEEYLSARQIPNYDVYLSFTGGPTLDRLERDFGSPAARALYCSADPGIYRPVAADRRWDLSYLGTYSADRQPALERLLIEPARRAPHLSFAIAGSNYPAEIEWPSNVDRLDHLPPAEHPAFYGISRFALNVTRADMAKAGHSPSIRLFEATACGTPVISDVWDGLGALFEPGTEILTADSTEDVLRALATDDATRDAIGAAGRKRTLEDHTPDRRAETLERELREAGWRKRKTARGGGRTEAGVAEGGRRVLVAGGAGFLGSHLCDRLLDQGDSVVCLDSLLTGSLDNLAGAFGRQRFHFIEADIVDPLDRGLFDGSRFDRIYNLACAASPPLYQANPEHTLLTSVIGVKQLLELAERHGARFLQASTSEIYGDPQVHPQPESYWGHVNATGPRACYDEGKRCAETLSFDFARAGRGDVRVARIFNTYGPRMSAADGRVVSSLVAQALAGDDITVFGSGEQTRSFCFVEDLIGGLIALMEHGDRDVGPVNLGNPTELSVNQLVEVVLRLTGSRSRIKTMDLPIDDPQRRRPDISKAGETLGWRPAVDLEQGLRETIAWLRRSAPADRRVSAGMA